VNPARLAGLGALFVGCTLGGFALGVLASNRTGASWWAIVGLFGGLVVGGGIAVSQVVRSVK
jgi:hypothetical protein